MNYAHRGFIFGTNSTTHIREEHTSLSLKPFYLLIICALFLSDKQTLSSDDKESLLALIDVTCLSEEVLERAYTSDLLPQNHVTRASLELCRRLRTELQQAKHVISLQEAELEKYGLGAKKRSSELNGKYF